MPFKFNPVTGSLDLVNADIDLSSPPPIGDVTPNSGHFTSLITNDGLIFDQTSLKITSGPSGSIDFSDQDDEKIFSVVENTGVSILNATGFGNDLSSGAVTGHVTNPLPKYDGRIAIERFVGDSSDTVDCSSYSRWLNGATSLDFLPSGGKWQQIAFSGSPNWAQLTLIHAMVNGVTLPQYLVNQSVYVDPSTYYEVDYGYGLAPANYTDFINDLFGQFDLQTQIYCTSGLTWQGPFCRTDNFFFVFEEVAFIDDGAGNNILTSPVYFSLQSSGVTLSDNYSVTFGDMTYPTSFSQKFWTVSY